MLGLIPIFFDHETTVSRDVTLRKLPLREYLQRCDGYGMAIALDEEEPTYLTKDMLYDPEIRAYITELLHSEAHIWVAHEASFDIRVNLHKYGFEYPRHWICTREASMCAFPNHPGGHGLANLGVTLNLRSGGKTGKGNEVGKMSDAERAAYCIQDTRLCRDVFNICRARIPDCEWQIGEICSRVKEVEIHIDHEAVQTALKEFTNQADTYGTALIAALDDDQQAALGVDTIFTEEGTEILHVRSVKPHQVKRLLLENLGFSTRTISAKKINTVALAAHPDDRVREVIENGSKANKALSHKRRVSRFGDASILDAELNWFSAHTGRFGSRTSGRGLNILAMPKHDKEVAKLVRSMFHLIEGFCFVRADEANVEYRVTGLLSKSTYVRGLFEIDIFSDPYAAFGQSCTGQVITKAMPVRQLFKAAVLGLGYGMGLETWVKNLLINLAKPKADFSLLDLQQTCEHQRWQFPHGRYAKGILTKLGCDPVVIAAGFHTRRLFHEVHPEFKILADWLVAAATLVSMGCGQAALDDHYKNPNAPLREHVDLQIHDGFEGYTLAIYIDGWPHPAVVWRDLGVRDIPGRGPSLSFMNGHKGYRGLYAAIAIENVVQAASRIKTCEAKLQMAALGWPYLFSVHDELLPVAPATPEGCYKARADLLTVMGPNRDNQTPWRWAVVVNPDEINVSRSFYEKDVGTLDPRFPTNAAWWNALGDHPELLQRLS